VPTLPGMVATLRKILPLAGLTGALTLTLLTTGCNDNNTAGPVELVPEAQRSSHFEAVASKLELGGHSFSYMDTESLMAELAAQLQPLLAIAAENDPMVGAVLQNADVETAFQALGIGAIKGVGTSAVSMGDYYHNSVYIYTGEAPKGLLALSGTAPKTLAGLSTVPADTDIYMEGSMDLERLRQTINETVTAIAGPTILAMAEAQMSQPIPDMEGKTIADILAQGETPILFALRFSEETVPAVMLPDELREQAFPMPELIVKVGNFGWLVEKLIAEAKTTSDPSVTFTGEGAAAAMHIEAPFGDVSFTLKQEDGQLVFGTDAFMQAAANGENLGESAAFATATQGLPAEGNSICYLSKNFFDTVQSARTQLKASLPSEIASIVQVYSLLLPIFFVEDAPQGYASLSRVEADGVLSLANWPHPTSSTLGEGQNAVVMGGLVAAMAIPAFEKIRQTSQQTRSTSVERIMDNDARMVSSAAQQYFLVHDTTEAPLDKVIGPDAYLPALSDGIELADENLNTLETIKIDQTFWLWHLPTGLSKEYTVAQGKPVE